MFSNERKRTPVSKEIIKIESKENHINYYTQNEEKKLAKKKK